MSQEVISKCEEKMLKTIDAAKKDFATIKTGKANPSILNNIKVEYYGSFMPINQLASVSAPDPQSILIKPFDKSILKEVEKAINTSGLGFNPLNDGELLRIPIAPLTEITRKDLVKQVKKLAEDNKIAIRNIRRESIDQIKKMEKDSIISEDELKRLSDKIQKVTDDYASKIDVLAREKEQDIMSI